MITTMNIRVALPVFSPAVTSASLLVVCILLLFAYVYLVASSVLDAVVHAESERAATMVQSEMAALETELIAAQHTISTQLAEGGGYESEQEKIFIDSREGSLVLGPAQ